MSLKRVAVRYAEALAELGQEYNNLDKIKEDIDLLRSLTANRDFFAMLKSPVIPHPKKKAVVQQLLEGKVDKITLGFLTLLINKERSEVLPEIALEFIEIYRGIRHISRVKITSAEKMGDDKIKTITDRLQKADVIMENVEIEKVINPELIGGFVLEFGDYRYDASVQNQLSDLRRDFKENLYRSKIQKR